MAFKELVSLDTDVTTALGGTDRKTGKKNPTSAEGFYLGSKKVEGKKGESSLHVFQTPKGNLGIWGKTDMDQKLKTVTPGTMTRVTFEKMVPTKNGDMYKYRVEVDAEHTIDVGSISDTLEASEETNSELDSEYTETQDEPADTAALFAQQQQRKSEVEALLKGKTKTK